MWIKKKTHSTMSESRLRNSSWVEPNAELVKKINNFEVIKLPKKIDQHHIHSRLVWGELKIIDVISSVESQISQPIHFARALHAFYILPSTHDKNNANTLWDLNSIFVWTSVLWRSSTWREMFETLNEPCAHALTICFVGSLLTVIAFNWRLKFIELSKLVV